MKMISHTIISQVRISEARPRSPWTPALFLILTLILMLTVLIAVRDASAQQPVLSAGVFSSGAGVSSGDVVMQSTVGQTFVGASDDDAGALGSGFWYQARAAGPVVVNSAPTAPQITDPPDGAEIMIGGSSGESPLDPETPFTVTWTAASDPDGDAVTYTWQLASSDDFSTLLLNEETGGATTYETTLEALASLFDASGTAADEPLTLWHRAAASDGQLTTDGTAAEVTLVRGTLVSSDDDLDPLPTRYALAPNYPNPFNPATTIGYALPEAAPVRLTVYDVVGRAVATLVDATQAAGSYEVRFDASGLVSGTYFYRIEAGNFESVGRMTLVK